MKPLISFASVTEAIPAAASTGLEARAPAHGARSRRSVAWPNMATPPGTRMAPGSAGWPRATRYAPSRAITAGGTGTRRSLLPFPTTSSH
ncbi:hypothetical protein P3W85_00965 [Cupriavidus basilensis]|uniref:Uncharacterized protein n=1 Tax=Cupriavidus basilensis TaxID=68895 RepID=A0ABT6AGT0_9BURK|nr:hypothetical protein [Cupriavidus basilensis]MDF3831537.1 hypothetical protein [Cupriavidus basilensis]